MDQSTGSVSATRLAGLVGRFDRSPAYVGLADAVTLLVGDGRVPLGARLPSERDLTAALGVSRTTVTRAYALLRETGYAEARQGSGTYARVPGGRARVQDRALVPGAPGGAGVEDLIDLNCAASTAPPGLAQAYADAVAQLPTYLGGHGYYPAGLPEAQAAVARSYTERGLPTDPEQVMITPGALTAAAIVSRGLTRRGDRLLVEDPAYPNATEALRGGGARLVGTPVDPEGWDLAAVARRLREVRPTLTYLIPDFQNPTGHVMSAPQRERYAAALRRSGAVAVVDEAHQALALDGQEMPAPFASFAPATITLGSASKSLWGGLRLGWIRAPHEQVERLTRARLGLDLGAPPLEQLVLARLLADPAPVLEAHRARLREQRDALLTALAEQLPSWRWVPPAGGLALWCRLPSPRAHALVAEAERRGVVVAPGPVFSVEGGLGRFVRVPWTRPADELREATRRLAEAWEAVASAGRSDERRPARVVVA